MKNAGHKLIIIRRIVQSVLFAFCIVIIWKTRYPLDGFINPAALFHFDPLVMLATAVAERIWLPGIWLALTTLAVTLLLGRVFCGWLCPLGALMDLSAASIRRLRRYREREPGKGKNTKYVILAGIAVLAVLGVQTAWLFDPLAIFVRAFSFNVHPAVNGFLTRAFEAVLQILHYPGPLESFYYSLKQNVLDIYTARFPHALTIFVFFLAILAAVVLQRRFWCRYLCPLGALLALVSRFSPFKRVVYSCRSNCSACKNTCRMNAIRTDNTYLKEECILCMDCLAVCPEQKAVFAFKPAKPRAVPPPGKGISRGQFLWWLGGILIIRPRAAAGQTTGATAVRSRVLRPPAALPEKEFVQRCVRCGNCMKVCLTNVLQPAVLESGWQGIWTPKLDIRIGYCEYQCTLCGSVCPTAAIQQVTVEEKKQVKIGTAVVRKDICLPWSKGEECLVCEEHCPVSNKAIKAVEQKTASGRVVSCPVVDVSLCVGCAICEFKCPAKPEKAITVVPSAD